MDRHLFEHRGWHSGAGQLVGLLSIAFVIWDQLTGGTSWWHLLWLPAFVPRYVWGALDISVFFHRMFSHFAFATDRFWELVGLFGGTAVCSGSSVQWACAHPCHHSAADTPHDPHRFTGWRSMFLFNYHYPEYDFTAPNVRKLAEDPVHRWLHHYYWLYNGFIASAILSLSIWLGAPEAFVYCYTLPTGLLLLMGGWHNIASHSGDGVARFAVDMPGYRYISLDEWRHGFHHAHPAEWDWGGLGSALIRRIRVA